MNVFSWDIAKATANFDKHGVAFQEAITIFADPNAWTGTIQSTRRMNFVVSV